MVNLQQFITQGNITGLPSGKDLHNLLQKNLLETLRNYAIARQELEDIWLKAYYAYSTTREGKRRMNAEAKQVIGKVKTRWRHNLKTPKAFETVETIVSYKMGAFFPNEKWFDFASAGHTSDPNFRTVLELNRKFVNLKLNEANFQDVYRMHIRDTCIAGTSAFMFPWHDVEQNSEFSVVTCFNFWLDPRSQNPNKGNIIRKYTLTKAEVVVNSQLFALVEPKQLSQQRLGRATFDRNLTEHIKHLQGINVQVTERNSDYVDIYEFWGDLILPKHNVIIKNVRANFTEDLLLSFTPNPYVQRPIIVSNYVQTSASPYGISCLQPVLPQLYYKDVMASRHADAIVSSVDPTYEVVADGVIDQSQVYFAPGHKILVTQKDTIRPLTPGGNMNNSVQDMSLIEQSIDKASGTGPFIGVGQGRASERVTKAEIDAQVAAGGNRLNDIYAHMQITLLLFLKIFRQYLSLYMMQQSSVEVRQLNPDLDFFNENIWVGVTRESFAFDVQVKPLGAANVATKEFKLRQLFDWLTIVGNNQQMAQQINWDAVLQFMTFTMLPDEAESFLMPVQQPQQTPTLEGQVQQVLQDAGAGADVRALEAAQQAGTLDQIANQIAPQL